MMLRPCAPFLLALALVSGSFAAFAGGTKAPPPSDIPAAAPFFPLQDVKPGLPIVMRTVMSGEAIEEIPGEIIGVMENALGPSQSLILARLTGDRADFAGVVAGMSGSPVYSGGRLVGALSYKIGTFTKEAIAGVTPIEYMLDLAKVGTKERDAAVSRVPLTSPFASWPAGAGGEGAALVPIDAPLVVTGVPPSVLDHFASEFAALGALPISGAGGSGSASASGAASRDLRPGDPIAAQLVRGDISVAATGTVTHVDGDRILAFGHPFLLSGSTELPMARAEIYLTLASAMASTKLARVTDTIGTWQQIRLPGIYGSTAHVPPLIPVTVDLRTPVRSASLHYEVATHRDWTPLLVTIAVASSLTDTPAFSDESTLRVSGRIRMEGHPDVVLEDLYTGFGGRSSAALEVAGDVRDIFGAVFQNRFETPQVRSIEITAEGIEQGRLSFVEGVWPTKTEASPGEEVQYHVRLRSFRGEISTRSFTFKIPDGIPRGDLQVVVGGASFLQASERAVLARRIAGADALDQIISIVNGLKASDALYAKAVRRLSGAVVQGEVLPALPPSVLTTLRANRGSSDVAPIFDAPVWEAHIPSDTIVAGGAVLALKIR